ncbi:hypothetical protein ABZ249_15375 [Nocardiopsis sp. NPDC006139]|uniref:hypothetical protein n=1 Tax=Nocardiopsis TaxID=2013 RepID=UPI0033B8CA40
MSAVRDDTAMKPSGICRAGRHRWRHDPPGGRRRMCVRCRSMSMINYPCGTDCLECHPEEES